MTKVLQGDCLEELKKLGSNSIDAVVTDPPYGIDYQSARRTDKSKWKPKIAGDKSPYIWFIRDAFRVLKDGGVLLCFTRYDTESDFRWAMKLAGFTVKAQVIWDKKIHGMGDLKGDFAPQHENIIFATKGRFIFPNKRPHSIITIQRVVAEKLTHPNEKPVELMEELIKSVTKEGNIVLDPFAGSGSTGIACQNLNRDFILIELEPQYVEIIKTRLCSKY